MKYIKQSLTVLSILAALILSGCSSIKLVNAQDPDYQKITNYEPVQGKAVLYIYRTKLSDFQGMATTVDIGSEELEIFSNMLHRFEIPAGKYSMEPNGIGMFAIEDELDIELEAGSVYFVELRHESRFGIPNKSALLQKTKEDLEQVMASDNLNIAVIKVI